MVLFPRALRPGDQVAVVSPSGPVRDRALLDRGVKRLEKWGFKPKLMPHCLMQNGYLAGSDDQRAQDLNVAFRDPGIRAVVCSRGGYGATRILDRLDFRPLANDPKPIVGYSDVTALLAAAFGKLGMCGFHGPMVATARSHAMGPECEDLQRSLLIDTETPPALPRDRELVPHTITPGRGEGRLVGGNLSLVVSLIGTRWQIDGTDRIVFLEEVGEDPYRVDRMLTQLLMTGFFERARGVVLGDFHLEGTPLASQSSEVVAVLRERLEQLPIPVTYGWPIGHRPRSWTLPYGATAKLEAEDVGSSPTLRLLEPGVE